MLKYLIKKPRLEESSSAPNEFSEKKPVEKPLSPLRDETSQRENNEPIEKTGVDCDLSKLPSDPGLRPRIMDYHPNIRERVRRQYYLNGPCQPRKHTFKRTMMGNKMRRFVPTWFDEFDWLEYSIEKEAAFCFYCYLFKNVYGNQAGGDIFVGEGFTDWKNKDKFRIHEGGSNSVHNQAYKKCKSLFDEKQHIETSFVKVTEQAKLDYSLRLNSSVKCIRFLLHYGLPFRGHDESESSKNRGLFIGLLQFLSDNNEEVSKVVLNNAPGNLKLISHPIQKEIVKVIASETTNVIINEVGGSLFFVLIDEARDVSIKEQMAVILRFVDKRGCVMERFLSLKQVASTTAKSLKKALDDLFSAHSLSISMLRGQGYDGASNMQGEYNGLKALILKENESAYYIHCFAHQLQLALVAVAKNNMSVNGLFNLISEIVNTVGGSCKKQDMLRGKQDANIVEFLSNEEIVSGKGLNQERVVARPADTRWGSHYRTLSNLITLFDSVVYVLDVVAEDGLLTDQKFSASRLLDSIQCFEFAFSLHLMFSILGFTNELSQALQRKDQDIENAIRLVNISKRLLQNMRDNGWSSLLEKVTIFCEKHLILVPSMDDVYIARGKSQRRAEKMTNFHHYHVELFNAVIDMQMQELNYRFNEANTELLLCIACLNPSNSFASFNNEKLIKLAQFYPRDFSDFDLMSLSNQLETFIIDMRSYVDLVNVKGLGNVTRLMVESRRDLAYPLVYKLYTLALILPVATANVERAFSGMKIVKSRLRNRMNDDWLNESLVVYIEKDISAALANEVIMRRFQQMDKCRGQL